MSFDCLSVTKAIHGEGLGLYGQLVKEIRARLTAFEYSDIMHESRSSNTDAHAIARCSVNREIGRHVWFIEPPEGIYTLYPKSMKKRCWLAKNAKIYRIRWANVNL
jgi:hypothetical protein